MMILQPVIVPIAATAPLRSPAHVEQQRRGAHQALRACARRCGAPPHGWTQDVDGVPLPNGAYHWSVSHKRHWAAAVVADRPVGIDIEHLAPRKRMLHDALADHGEWAVLGGRSWEAFFRLWTAKEATLKANGRGIAGFLACRLVQVPDDLHLTLEYDGKPWAVEHFLCADHIVSVTHDAQPVEWCVLQAVPAGGESAGPDHARTSCRRSSIAQDR